MERLKKTAFRGLKASIALAIKESCYTSEVRLYNIANGVHKIETFGLVNGLEGVEGLGKIIDRTIKDSVGVGCDLSVVVKGLFLGSFRSCSFKRQESSKVICLLINEVLGSVFKYKGNVKEAIDGLLSAIFFVAFEFKLDAQESLTTAREDILSSAKGLDPAFADDVNKFLPKFK